MSRETDIITELLRILNDDVAGINSVHYETIQVATSDFRDHEIPAAQLWDVGMTIKHERGRALKTWSLAVELITKSTVAGQANQAALLNLRRDTELALWNKPNLGIPGVIHLVYTGNITDLHLLDPYFIARIDFSVLFYDDLTGSC